MNCWSLTDKGIVRKQNEDSMDAVLMKEKDCAVCIVCDGMGGARAGNVASRTARERFMMAFLRDLEGSKSPAQIMEKAVGAANAAVYAASREHRECAGMGTTLVAAFVRGSEATIVNVGDSRAYFVNDDGIKRITRDHSVVEDMIDRGDITREEARRHPDKNLITRVLGTELDVSCDVFVRKIESGEFILLCSDGLSNLVSEQEILYEVLHGGELDTCCDRLLSIAKERGAPDNVTMILLQR
ncbi:MAG: Stp1/IreP family PP2C-type Ser/Thr phosphatase [Oscillospiraceae bacterium]|nr:Stp1/IreP family PP2C-type Ser/Thr phosphatase [Oscillospiraceae bacterium]